MTPVSIMRDITINLIVPATATHDFTPLPPVPPVPPPLPAVPLALTACAIEPPTNVWWPPGMALAQNKFTTTVIHQGMCIALDGHDCGVLIPHVQVAPAPNNLLTALHIAFSSRKSMFVASTVVMNGASPACCVMVAWPPSPMVYCANPMSPPLADAVTSYLNTVKVGMTLADWLIGAVSIAASMVIDKFLGGDQAKTYAGFRQAIVEGLLGSSSLRNFAAKTALGLATGAARLLFTDGPASMNIGAGCPYLQLQGGVSRGADGNYGGGVSSQLGPVGSQVTNTGVSQTVSNPTGSTTNSHNWGQSGSSSSSTDVSPTEGFRTTTTSTDASGNTTATDSGGRGSTPPPGEPL